MAEPHGNGDLTGNQKFILNLVDKISAVIVYIFKAAVTISFVTAFVLVAYFLTAYGLKAEIQLQGNANFAITIFSLIDAKVKWAPWGIAIGAILYGFLERELRRRKTKYLQGRITKLEKLIDPKRESSGLTERGETPGVL